MKITSKVIVRKRLKLDRFFGEIGLEVDNMPSEFPLTVKSLTEKNIYQLQKNAKLQIEDPQGRTHSAFGR